MRWGGGCRRAPDRRAPDRRAPDRRASDNGRRGLGRSTGCRAPAAMCGSLVASAPAAPGLDPRGPSGDGLRSSLALSGKTGASSGSLSTWKDSSELSSTSVVLCLGRDLRLLLAEVLAAPMSFVLSSALLRSSFTVSMLQASDSRQKQTSDVAQKEFEKGETEVSTEQSKQKFQPKWLQNNGSQEKNKVGDADTCLSGQTATPLVESAQLSQKKASRTSGLH